MSHLPGAMTKQILSAPPRIMRSTRYSLTAHGRAIPASVLLPTGRSSFENASGWMRLPRPAAGMMPHMSGLRHFACTHVSRTDQLLEFTCALLGRMFLEHTLARCARDPRKFGITDIHRGKRVRGAGRDQNFRARREERVQSGPGIAKDRGPARRRLEQAARRAPAILRHRWPCHIECQPRGGEKGCVLARWQMPDEVDVIRPGKLGGVLR